MHAFSLLVTPPLLWVLRDKCCVMCWVKIVFVTNVAREMLLYKTGLDMLHVIAWQTFKRWVLPFVCWVATVTSGVLLDLRARYLTWHWSKECLWRRLVIHRSSISHFTSRSFFMRHCTSHLHRMLRSRSGTSVTSFLFIFMFPLSKVSSMIITHIRSFTSDLLMSNHLFAFYCSFLDPEFRIRVSKMIFEVIHLTITLQNRAEYRLIPYS